MTMCLCLWLWLCLLVLCTAPLTVPVFMACLVCAHFRVTLCLLFFYVHWCALTHFFRHSCVCASCLRLVLVCDGGRCVCICDVHFHAFVGRLPTLIHTHTPSATNPSLRAGTHFPYMHSYISTIIHPCSYTAICPYSHTVIYSHPHVQRVFVGERSLYRKKVSLPEFEPPGLLTWSRSWSSPSQPHPLTINVNWVLVFTTGTNHWHWRSRVSDGGLAV